jgi:hypothetical protein
MSARPLAFGGILLLIVARWGPAQTPGGRVGADGTASEGLASGVDPATPTDAGPGELDEPRAAEVSPTTEEERPEAREDETRVLDRILGLVDAPVSAYGWIQNSFTGTPGLEPRDGSNVTVAPNRLANRWQGNQYYLIVEDAIEPGDRANLGFRLDTLFGNDWSFTKSLGLFDQAFTPFSFAGLDFPQIYGEAHLPIRDGVSLDVKGGRFYSPAGYEAVMAVKRPLLSWPNLLTYTPFTFFGALTSLHLGDRTTLFNGAVNGTDRWINSNYRYSYLGGLNWNSRDGRTTFSTVVLVGPNQLPFFPGAGFQTPTLPVGAYTYAPLAGRRNPFYGRSTLVFQDAVVTHAWGESKRLTQALEAFYITEGNVLGYGPGGGPGRISYYGGAHWLLYECGPKVTAVSRLEVFRDNNGFVLPAPDNYYEMTHGLIFKPRPHLWIRPEIRYDWAQFTTPFDDGRRSGQLTLAFDVIVRF